MRHSPPDFHSNPRVHSDATPIGRRPSDRDPSARRRPQDRTRDATAMVDRMVGELLAAQIPRLRRYARALTKNVQSADDLV